MAEDIPVSEVRRVVINYEIKAPQTLSNDNSAQFERELIERVRRELIRTGRRNRDIFGGTA